MHFVERIEALFLEFGARTCSAAPREPVSALAHALQCAQLAEWADAPPELVAASFLHDIGHFIDAAPSGGLIDDAHELRAVPFLSRGFGADVVQPVRLHVQAKRYLVRTDARYLGSLSPASLQTLALQGGPMSEPELSAFEALPHAPQALALRRWDDLARTPGKSVPPIQRYLCLLSELCTEPRVAASAPGRGYGSW
ncbi:putative HD phosphohydrolase [Sphaerotilus hippei]|uniref:Putative HD phosphohydrolase n=1 Tax=Sphaerotilus hippei TaxID=744406 RepID=A0A318GXH0_9BURK|nr:phosphohydrolase [Sphaerotilus hippei]PXW94435.1 putative HD phosphohydrolase [Sphaerotilus hippei]